MRMAASCGGGGGWGRGHRAPGEALGRVGLAGGWSERAGHARLRVAARWVVLAAIFGRGRVRDALVLKVERDGMLEMLGQREIRLIGRE